MVVSHVSILQCLIAYFRNTPVEECMSIEIPMHTVVKFTPVRGGGWKETRIRLCDVEGLPSPPGDDEVSPLPSPVITPPSAGVPSGAAAAAPPATAKDGKMMPQVESSSEVSTLSVEPLSSDPAISPSPIWGDHVLRRQKVAAGMVKGTS